jgi:aminopeptidase N
MLDAPMQPTRRLDYRPPAFLVDRVELQFDLHPAATTVTARLELRRNPAHGDHTAPLHLDGEATLLSLKLDGQDVETQRYRQDAQGLTVFDVPDAAVLDVATRIDPAANTDLSGLYVSGGAFFTQCEAEGFRRITYFPDRPDVMARYAVTITAAGDVPVLLSNGNPDGSGRTADGRHWARWDDPHPKPSYLFALVAGDLVSVRDHFITASGREVALGIWVRRGDETSCDHAMHCLKQAMRWDEETFGLEYDLDVFNIAAVSDFNMGAMENKGLNVFNTKYVLARPDTATDGDYQGIETVIAHEYFHNWTGNRITCRDWFQLSLKEGLTVFRDQQFSMDQGSAAVKRIGDVRVLRAAQFREDAGPLAHPVRPDSYVAIDNFYTATVYQKGAEVVRMMHTMLGREGFRRGMAEYVRRHDNSAATIEDFVAALSAGGGIDLSPFLAWYAQAGTPEITVRDHYDAGARRYVLTLSQETPATPGQADKRPLPIPVAAGLLAPDGQEIAARTLLLDAARQEVVFEGVPVPPEPSLLRGFSAPVRLAGLSRERLRFLAAHDTDPVARWDSLQQYALQIMRAQAEAWAPDAAVTLDDGLMAAMRATLERADADHAYAAEMLALPQAAAVAAEMPVERWEALYAVRESLRTQIGTALRHELRATYDRLTDTGPYRIDGAAIGGRALRNACLRYLAAAGDVDLAHAQFAAQANMTDVLSALSVLSLGDDAQRGAALAAFHARWRDDPLVLDKWFAIQAESIRPQALDDVQALYRHPDFSLRNPNRVRALVGAFAHANPLRFHAASGAGYAFLTGVLIELDPLNGQVAARLMGPLANWRRQEPARAAMMRACLERLRALPGLSRWTAEKVAVALQ